MPITREQVETLDRLYRKRHDIQKAREYASDRHLWIGIADREFGGTGTRSSILNAVGGTADFIALMTRALNEHFEMKQRNLDAEIEQNGGTP